MTARSIRSMKSVRSLTENEDSGKVMQFEEYISMACDRFNCPYPVVVKRDVQRDDFMKTLKQEGVTKYKTISLSAPKDAQKPPISSTPATEAPAATSVTSVASLDEEAILVTAVYDNMHRLAELCLSKLHCVPRTLMQIICLIIPYYEHLTKLYFKRCRIDKYTIHELFKVLPMSHITDVTLDDCPLPEANYAILLERRSLLNNLSLCRCNIDDAVCIQIASQLHYLAPAESTLGSLNLSFNHITDLGAIHLANALRSNRHLRYLNLANNHIGDDGAGAIFNILVEFPLTYDEIKSRRRRLIEYLKTKTVLYIKYLSELDAKSLDELSQSGRRQTLAPVKKRKSSATSLRSKSTQLTDKKEKEKQGKNKNIKKENMAKAEIMAIEMVGPFRDPFSVDAIKMRENYTYCLGNMILCYVNFAYNNLSYLSLKKLHSTLVYQSIHKKLTQAGLMRVVIEGNPLPMSCSEMASVGELMGRSVGRLQLDYGARRKSRNRMSIVPDRVKH